MTTRIRIGDEGQESIKNNRQIRKTPESVKAASMTLPRTAQVGNRTPKPYLFINDCFYTFCPNFLILTILITSEIKIPQTAIMMEHAINNNHKGALSLVAKSDLLLKVLTGINLAPQGTVFSIDKFPY